MRSGSWARASRVEATTAAAPASAITMPAARNDSPVTAPPLVRCERKPRKLCEKIEQPEDREHDAGSAGDASRRRLGRPREPGGRPYSDSHAAIATPSGAAITIADAVTSRVPTIGSRKPPACFWCSDGAAIDEQFGLR